MTSPSPAAVEALIISLTQLCGSVDRLLEQVHADDARRARQAARQAVAASDAATAGPDLLAATPLEPVAPVSLPAPALAGADTTPRVAAPRAPEDRPPSIATTTATPPASPATSTASALARAFVLDALHDAAAPLPGTDLTAMAATAGIASRTHDRARADLLREGLVQRERRGQGWAWSLATTAPEPGPP